MARMHSDEKGQSGSSNPITKKEPEWVDYEEEEIIDLVLKLKQEGKTPSEIGIKLRDTYGIPSVKTLTGKKITEILEENNIAPDIPEDLQNLVEKADSIAKHVRNNPNDTQAERQLELTQAKVKRVADYHRKEGNLPEDWKYDRSEV